MAIGSQGINSSPLIPFPILPFPGPFRLGLSLGLSLGTYPLAIPRVAFLVLIAGIDGRAERFFQKVSPLGVSGIPYGCKACGHGKKKMRNYFHLFEEKLWTNFTRLVGCTCRREQGDTNAN
jgi:hypothetical protein